MRFIPYSLLLGRKPLSEKYCRPFLLRRHENELLHIWETHLYLNWRTGRIRRATDSLVMILKNQLLAQLQHSANTEQHPYHPVEKPGISASSAGGTCRDSKERRELDLKVVFCSDRSRMLAIRLTARRQQPQVTTPSITHFKASGTVENMVGVKIPPQELRTPAEAAKHSAPITIVVLPDTTRNPYKL